MGDSSLQAWVTDQDDLLASFRAQGQRGSQDPSVSSIPPEYTNWIDEQRALLESCAIGDLSHHMTAVRLEGPEALEFLSHLCVNDFSDFSIGRAKQIVMCSPDGYLIGDGPLLRLDDDVFYGPGIHGTKWLRFQLERGDFDVSASIEPPTPLLGESGPAKFVYQLQGPTTATVLDEVTDDDLESIGFFEFANVTVAGIDVIAFGHGMSPEAGYEFIGPYAHADDFVDALLQAGAPHDIRRLGRRTYVAQSTKLGWIPPWPKPVYHGEAMRPYREWVDVDTEHKYGKAYWTERGSLETHFSIEGSFESDDIRDYYLDPVEVGYGKLIDLDGEFIGKAAIEDSFADQHRRLVSLRWNDGDVTRVADSVFGDGDLYKGLGDLPLVRRATMPYDEVLADGERVGISYTRAYQWDVRGVVSLASLDPAVAEPGTTLTVVWGEPRGHSPNPAIEDHEVTEITAEVRPAPYKAKEK